MLALRKPENCSVIVEGGGALAALQAMKAHPREVAVQVWPSLSQGSVSLIFGVFLGFFPLFSHQILMRWEAAAQCSPSVCHPDLLRAKVNF